MKYVLVLLVIVFVLWWMWGRGERGSGGARPSARSGRGNGDDATPEAMVRCAHCGVHLPRSDALPAPDGALYCSAAHRLAGPPA